MAYGRRRFSVNRRRLYRPINHFPNRRPVWRGRNGGLYQQSGSMTISLRSFNPNTMYMIPRPSWFKN